MGDISLTSAYTMVELAKRTNNKVFLDIAEVLDKKLAMIRDGVWVEANQLTGHVHAKRVLLPTGTWRAPNSGVAASISQVSQNVESIGLLEDRSEIDEYLVEISPDPRTARYQEDIAHVEGLAQTFSTAIWYGNLTSPDPLKPTGFTTRYNTLGTNVLSCGASGGASLWIIEWGVGKVHFIYPRGQANTFVKMIDLGKQLMEDGITSGNKLVKYVTQYKINGGIVINDERCIARLCNIGTGTANLVDEDLLIQLLNNMPDEGESAVIYCNPTVKTQFDIKAKNKPGLFQWSQDPFGKPVLSFRGVPVRVDQMLTTSESTVS